MDHGRESNRGLRVSYGRRRVFMLGLVVAVGVVISAPFANPSVRNRVSITWRAYRDGLSLGEKVPGLDGHDLQLFLWRLPGGGGVVEMVYVSEGEFVMGADDGDAAGDERPKHMHVMRRGYYIARNDTTWREYRAFCRATRRSEPAPPWYWGELQEPRDMHPVVGISWDDAQSYCTWAGLRLPTEAEWEKAARGTDGRTFPWGNAWDPGRANYCDASASEKYDWRDRDHTDGFPFTSPVGSFANGAPPYGALDMAGNVWQCCADWYDPRAYQRYAERDFASPSSGLGRVFRGGSWHYPSRLCRTSSRNWIKPADRSDTLGFRPVKSGS